MHMGCLWCCWCWWMSRSADGSIGDETALPGVMSKQHAIVLIKDGCDICIIPRSWSCAILIPSRWSGLPRSCISKLPPISLTIDFEQLVTMSPSLTYHPMISTSSLLKWKKTVVLALPGLNPNFSISCFNVWCQTWPNYLSP